MNIQAQTNDAKWNIGLLAGITQYKGTLGNDFYKTSGTMHSIVGVSITRYIADRIDVNLLVGRGGLGISTNNPQFENFFSTALLSMRVHILSRNSSIRPYLLIGAGTLFYDKNSNIKSDVIDMVAPSYGGGININLGSSARLNIQEAFHYTSKDKIDIDVPDEKATFLFHTISVSFDIANKQHK